MHPCGNAYTCPSVPILTPALPAAAAAEQAYYAINTRAALLIMVLTSLNALLYNLVRGALAAPGLG